MSFLNLFIAEAIDLGSEVGCVVYIIKANIVIDCKDGEACHMYTDDNLTLEADNRIICHIGHLQNTRKYPIVCCSINITFDTELWSELCASPG